MAWRRMVPSMLLTTVVASNSLARGALPRPAAAEEPKPSAPQPAAAEAAPPPVEAARPIEAVAPENAAHEEGGDAPPPPDQ